MIRLILVSDTHFSPAAPDADRNWSAAVEEIARRAPDLVVHIGDITLDGAHDPAELDHARARLDRLPVRWLAIPGNHDIGDIGEVDEPRLRRYHECFGEGSWIFSIDGWRLVGVDVQTLASAPPASDRLWNWLHGAIDGRQPTAVFVHRPLLTHADDEVDDPRRYVVEPARSRLLRLLGDRDVRLVASGHVHQWRSAARDGVHHVWAPSTWATLPDRIQPVIGAKVTGIVAIELGESVAAALVRPEGMTCPTIGEDFPSPYAY